MVAIYETERPRDLNEVCGQDAAVRKVRFLERTSGLIGQVLWITGKAGTGKTTIARIVANSISDEFSTIELDAQDVSLERLREWERLAQYRPLTGGAYVFIVNEAHFLNSRSVSRLQTLLEDRNVQRNTTWIFTTTLKGEEIFKRNMDATPFLSRTVAIRLESDDATIRAMALRLQDVSMKYGIEGHPAEAFEELLIACGGNMREALQRIATGEMADPVTLPQESEAESYC